MMQCRSDLLKVGQVSAEGKFGSKQKIFQRTRNFGKITVEIASFFSDMVCKSTDMQTKALRALGGSE